MPAILCVCLANVCRSPAAEAMLRHLAEKGNFSDIVVDSCGIGDWHMGKLPDERMQRAAHDRGLVLSGRAKIFDSSFFDSFDYILAMDRMVLHELYVHARTPENKAKIHLITDYSITFRGEDIPDPYYKGEGGFETVLDMLEESCECFLRACSKSSN